MSRVLNHTGLVKGTTRARVLKVKLAQFCDPPLTTVHIPRDEIGRTICGCLMNDERAFRAHEFVIDPELVVRYSAGPAATPSSLAESRRDTRSDAGSARARPTRHVSV